MCKVLAEATVVIAILTAIALSFEVVVARCAFGITPGFTSMLNDLLHPPILGLLGWLQALVALIPYMTDTGCDVIPLSLQHVR